MMLLYLGLIFTCLLGRGDGAAVYDYSDGPNGPAHWGELDPSWTLCGSGMAQSPVNITSEYALSDSITGAKFNYTGSPATVIQIKPHQLEFLWEGDEGGISLGGVYYKLESFHLHSPSEHTLDGIRFPLEIHRVHRSVDDELSVVSILYTDGETDDFLSQALEELAHVLASGEKEAEIGNVLTVDSMKLGSRYYGYSGSLTTPPCTEGVSWVVMQKTRTVAAEQIQALLDAGLGNNARPLQDLNGRHIYSRRRW